MSERIVTPKREHEVAYEDLVALVRKHADDVDGYELLAIAANMLGKLIALQDQRVVTPAMAMDVVAKNIEMGNEQAMREMSQTKGSA
jgi:hypothetical protein